MREREKVREGDSVRERKIESKDRDRNRERENERERKKDILDTEADMKLLSLFIKTIQRVQLFMFKF